ncbi:MAG TPA: ABC transporter permease [Dehalococcoidia bacterium]|nr:ABC transporter permease [Dehalococcoidia bacterium]
MTTQTTGERISLPDEQLAREARGRRVNPGQVLRGLAAEALPPLAALVIVVAAWWAYVEIDNTPEYFLPAPDAVAEELFDRPEFYIEHAWYTLKNALAGLAIGGGAALILAVAMAHSRLIEKSVFPIAIAIKVTPVVAIAPLFTVWWGFGVEPKIAVAALIAWFPMLVNGIVGFRSVEPAALDFMRSIDASATQIFNKLRLPSSLPYLIAGLRVALPLSIIGAVVAEWFGSAEGLGRVIQISNANLDLPTVFAAVVVLAIIGIVLNLALSLIERSVLSWHSSNQ